MNNCKKCGEQINSGEKFCRNCGEPTGQKNFVEESREGVINSEINTTPLQNNINSNQNLNNQENVYNQIPNNNINNTQKNKNSNIIPYIILSVIVVVLISVVGILIILNISKKDENNTNHNNTNDYEENITDNKDEDDDIDLDDTIDKETDSITYKGFKFIKKSGYNYEDKSSSLIISNDSYFTGMTISPSLFSSLKNNLTLLEAEYKKNNLDITNLQTKTINGTEVIVGDASVNGYKGTWYIIESSKTGYVYQGYITNRSYTINYSDVSIVLSLFENAEYVGNYTNYSSDVSSLIK